MKKSLILCSMLLAACFANAAEHLFNTQASCELQSKLKLEFKNGNHVLRGNCHFWSTKMFKYNPAKKYSISAEIMTDCKIRVPGLSFGYVLFADNGYDFIRVYEYYTSPNGFTELAKAVGPTDTVITVKKPAGFKNDRNKSYVLAFEAKEDESDLPNSKVTTAIKKMDIGADTITLTVAKPTFAAYPAGTKVRFHFNGSFFYPVNNYERANGTWRKIGGAMKFPKGARNFKPCIIYYSNNKAQYIYVRNFKMIEE